MPYGARVPRVVTIHDMTVFDHPEWHQRSKVALFRRAIRVASEHAQALICVSSSTASRLAELVAPRAPVYVVEHGVDHSRFCPEEPEEGADAVALARVEVRQPYVAFIGTVEPRKDVPRLVAAFDKIARAHPGLGLVIAGTAGWGEQELIAAIWAPRHADRIRRLGYVSDDLVPALQRRAAAVAYPSLQE